MGYLLGLLRLKELSSTQPAAAESAVKYLLILTDDDTLFNHALGTYDLQLVLLVGTSCFSEELSLLALEMYCSWFLELGMFRALSIWVLIREE